MLFVKTAMHLLGSNVIRCPCRKCQNMARHTGELVVEHLVINGMDMTYTTWILHGEPISAVNPNAKKSEARDMYEAAFTHEQPTEETGDRGGDTEFTEMLEDAETPLFPGCTKYTRLSAVATLYKHKTAHGLSDHSFNELLGILRDMLPEENTIPESMYATKKLLKSFDLGYERIDACKNDCCLFRGGLKDLEACPKCGSSRWKTDQHTGKVHIGVPTKVLRYFPIVPRLRRMFKSQWMAEHLRWHSRNRSEDGNMRHPVDSVAWDLIDRKWPSFSSDVRNIRLGLAADGFNPFRDLSSRYSCWPVILATYNLPPWLCMKQEHLMLTLLIPGPKQPGNDIDIYLRPLIDDLKNLWENGVDVYDVVDNSFFKLKAVLMWTINDFPAYGNLAGCTTKGRAACPVCGVNTCSQWLSSSKKSAYMGHRRFLPHAHPYRTKKNWFDGKVEPNKKPKILTGSQVLAEIKDIENDWGKGEKKTGKRKRQENVQMWKKKSIFFELPYWEVLYFIPFFMFKPILEITFFFPLNTIS